ncbi:nitric oxide reductase NorD protein [Cohaesibacter sp. ES.047]|uniref:nitric oxide reductase activation protein NorD n=1 Tax=Cohaesibacter sp. ES.047 TaxID=1798205 RepID=UPI000BB8F253|nr:VWA domain-containing protein [Cohaesibacter sp. ES.047]SNY91160.1 nitric oxide reductase NorD protein [Cohaesibacter sp. ES.047]
MHLLDLMEPEETVGNLWHEMASSMGVEVGFPDDAVSLDGLSGSLLLLFRALGGSVSVELVPSPATVVKHRRTNLRKLGAERDREWVAGFDGERLRLPPVLAAFPDAQLNRACYFWLTALAALHRRSDCAAFSPDAFGPQADRAQVRANQIATERALEACPGLARSFRQMCLFHLQQRRSVPRAGIEAHIEEAVVAALKGLSVTEPAPSSEAGRGYAPFMMPTVWLQFDPQASGTPSHEQAADDAVKAPLGAVTSSKVGERKEQDQTNRKDSFVIHRFESILSWVESMNINRSVDDDDLDNAQKAAEDQDRLTLSKHDRRVASRLRLHLDLSPADALHEKLAGEHIYDEWDHRASRYLDGHCRVLEAPAHPDAGDTFVADPRRIRAVRRQFEALRPRRKIQPRQIDGSELDLDAMICMQTDLMATGYGSDRIWQDERQSERDLSVAFLIDTSRSTEAAIGDTSVIDVAKDAMTALAYGIDAAGDHLGIWSFSSLKRDRVFVTKVKDFADPMAARIADNIASLKPGHFTRLGTAIRHVASKLESQPSARKLLIVLTDGKPNDLDHYEGQHGIEDSHMAVREARRAGLTLHGVIIDEDGQDWFARIFGRGGFTLLPHPERLIRALPEIYRTLTRDQ